MENHLPALKYFIVRADRKELLSANLYATAEYSIVIIESLTDCKDFWSTQLLSVSSWEVYLEAL
jgi:hypothetical protein